MVGWCDGTGEIERLLDSFFGLFSGIGHTPMLFLDCVQKSLRRPAGRRVFSFSGFYTYRLHTCTENPREIVSRPWRCAVIDIRCPYDGTVYHADESHVGRSVRCKTCGWILRVERPSLGPIVKARQQSVKPASESGWIKRPSPDSKSRFFSVLWDRIKLYALAIASAGVILAIVWPLIFPSPSSIEPSTPPPVSAPVSNNLRPVPLMKVPELKEIPVPSFPQVEKINPQRFRLDPNLKPLAPIELLPTCATGQEVERPSTGEDVEPGQEAIGECRLIVKNGSGHDAAVRLTDFDSGQTIRFVYVRSRDSYPILGIGDVTVFVRFETGADWIPACKGFIKNQDIEEFDDLIPFKVRTEENEDSTTTYSTHASLTLNPVIGGNAKTHRIGRDRFFEGDQYVRVAP